MQMTKAFITGITGFIGQPLAKSLAERGFAVSGIARNPFKVPNCSVYEGNVLDPDSYGHRARESEVVVHLAAPTVASYIARHPLETMTTNVGGLLNLLNFFADGNGRHFLFVSTGKVYGRSQQLPLKEESELRPVGALGKAKQESENVLKFFAEFCPNKRFSVMRLFNAYGPEQNGDFLVPTIIRQMAAGSITLGDIGGRRDFIYVDDAVSGMLSVITSPEQEHNFNIYNLGTGKSYSPADLVGLLEEITQTKLTLVSDENRVRRGEPDEERADIRRLQSLGWQPQHSMRDGLELTWKAHFQEYLNGELEQAVILAGGRGARLGKLTDNTPKPLVAVNGSPYLEHQLNLLKRDGVKEVTICTGYLAEQIEEHFGGGEKIGLTVKYSREQCPLGTGGALKLAGKALPPVFFLLYGDSYLDIDYQELYQAFCRERVEGPFGMMVITKAINHDVAGNVKLDHTGARIASYKKGAAGDYDYVDAGVLVLSRAVTDWLPENEPCALEEHLYPRLAGQSRLAAFTTSAKFYDIGTPERLTAFQRNQN